MDINIISVIAATIAMFIVGAFWYMVPFGKIWGKIHDFDKYTPEQQKKMQSEMGKWYLVQLIVTLFSAIVLAILINLIPNESPYLITFLVWLGFVVPTEASAMIFGGSKPEYIWHKILISIFESLLHLLVATFVLGLF